MALMVSHRRHRVQGAESSKPVSGRSRATSQCSIGSHCALFTEAAACLLPSLAYGPGPEELVFVHSPLSSSDELKAILGCGSHTEQSSGAPTHPQLQWDCGS